MAVKSPLGAVPGGVGSSGSLRRPSVFSFVLAGVAFFVNSVVKPVAEPVAALAPAAEAVAGAVPSLPLSRLSILRFILASLGIPLDPLIKGSSKCVTELGPEAVGAVKTLLVMWASSLNGSPSLCGWVTLPSHLHSHVGSSSPVCIREPLLPVLLQEAIS